MIPPILPPSGDLRRWAENATVRIRQLIDRHNKAYPQIVQLEHITPGAKATQNGMFMWDEAQKCPVISVDGEWKKVALL